MSTENYQGLTVRKNLYPEPLLPAVSETGSLSPLRKTEAHTKFWMKTAKKDRPTNL